MTVSFHSELMWLWSVRPIASLILLTCLPASASPPVPQKRHANGNQLVARLHHPATVCPLPTPQPSHLKHRVKPRGSCPSRVLGCCCVNWSGGLALLMEKPHAAQAGKQDGCCWAYFQPRLESRDHRIQKQS